MPFFEEVVSSPDQLAGVKAIWGAAQSRIQCFGPRGDKNVSPDKYFMIPKAVAKKALHAPFIITIGGGANVEAPLRARIEAPLRARIIEVMKLTSVYGETAAFIDDQQVLEDLAQWPVAVAVLDVYEVAGYPHLNDDLLFEDKSILANAYDIVVRPEPAIDELWHRLNGFRLELKNLPPLTNFRAPNKLVLVSSRMPTSISRHEGQRCYKEVAILERKSELADMAKEHNRQKNDGRYVCETCHFSASNKNLLDAHHLQPLALGQRLSVLADFAILCPTCHRICHHAGDELYRPLTLQQLKAWLSENSRETLL